MLPPQDLSPVGGCRQGGEEAGGQEGRQVLPGKGHLGVQACGGGDAPGTLAASKADVGCPHPAYCYSQHPPGPQTTLSTWLPTCLLSLCA